MERDARIAALSLSLVCAIPLLSATRDTASAASARAQMGLISGIAGRCMNGGESLAVGAIMTAGGCCCDASSSTMVRRAFVFCVRAFFEGTSARDIFGSISAITWREIQLLVRTYVP